MNADAAAAATVVHFYSSRVAHGPYVAVLCRQYYEERRTMKISRIQHTQKGMEN